MALDTFNPYLFVSAGEQSNKFLTPTYADGIAQFQAQRAQELTGLTVRIDAIQEGTGDPSPSNIRPISGRTGLTVTRCGKNLAKLTNSAIVNADIGTSSYTLTGLTFSFTKIDDYSISQMVVNGTPTARTTTVLINNLAAVMPPGRYILSGCPSGGASNKYRLTCWDNTAGVTAANDYGSGATFELVEGHSVNLAIDFSTAMTGQSVSNLVFKPMIRPVSDSNDAYEPYDGTSFPITWQTHAGTVYGGTLDVASGVLTVTHAYKEYTGQTIEAWTESSWTKTNTFVAYSNVDLQNSKKEGSRYMCITACNMFPLMGYDELRNADTNGITITGGLTASYPSIRIDKTAASTVAELQTYLASNPLTIVYELATPQTVQLDPEQIMTLPGFNQIYSDAGPVIDIKF